jgi:hypothetical protein
MEELMYVYIDRTDESMDGWIDGWFVGWMVVWMKGCMVSSSETIPA